MRIMKFLIDNFGVSNLFGRENYEYYARITGRILKVEEAWIFSFRYPPDNVISRECAQWRRPGLEGVHQTPGHAVVRWYTCTACILCPT